MRLAALSYNIPQSYPIFQVEIEKLLVSSAKKCGFSGAGVHFCGAKENQKSFSRWWRGAKRFFIKANVLFCVPKENQKSTSDFDALEPTGCGSQRLLRCRLHPAGRCPNSSSLYPPQAAVVAVARKGLLAPFRPRRSCRNGKKLAASLNAFFSFLRLAASQLVLRPRRA